MFGQLGKFDQRILPSSDMVRITPYAINKAIHREQKEQFNRKRKKKNKPSYQETISLSADIPEDDHENDREDVFAEYTDSSTWVALTPLLANASMRHKFICLKLGLAAEAEAHATPNDDEPESPLASLKFKAYQAYQTAAVQKQAENHLSFQEKMDLSNLVNQETPEELQTELENLKELIPGLQALIDAGYSHMPIVEGNSFIETVSSSTQKLKSFENQE